MNNYVMILGAGIIPQWQSLIYLGENEICDCINM